MFQETTMNIFWLLTIIISAKLKVIAAGCEEKSLKLVDGAIERNRKQNHVLCSGVSYEELQKYMREEFEKTSNVDEITVANSYLYAVRKELFISNKTYDVRFLNFTSVTIEYFEKDFLKPFPRIRCVEIRKCSMHIMDIRLFLTNPSLNSFLLEETSVTKYIETKDQHLNTMRQLSYFKIARMTFPNVTFFAKYFKRSVNRIVLERNNITDLDITAFGNVNDDAVLEITYNRIFSMKNYGMNNNNRNNNYKLRFRSLNMTGSTVQNFDPAVFQHLNLERIYLDYFSFDVPVLKKTLFSGSNLRVLSMKSSKMNDIEAKAFTNCLNLDILSLPFNNISFVRNESLSGLTFLTKLDLSHNQIWKLDDRAFADLNSLKELNLTFNRLKEFNGNILHVTKSIRVIDLGNNRIKYVDNLSGKFGEYDFRSQLYNKLYLRNNRIETLQFNKHRAESKFDTVDFSWNFIGSIEPGTFHNLNTRVLDLSNSFRGIETIKTDTFFGLLITDNLILSHNNITMLELYSFQNLNSLKSLELQCNRIRVIYNETFSGLTDLQRLNISWNNITKLEPYSFTELSGLKILDLQFNNIRNVQEDTFLGLFELNVLNLAGNKIKFLEPRFFSTGTDLKRLRLRSNGLQKIYDDAFHGLAALEHLDLSCNNITKLQPFSFKELLRLKILELQFNGIQQVSNDAFYGLNSLETLNLSYNSIKYMDIAFKSFSNKTNLILYSYNSPKTDCGDRSYIGHIHVKDAVIVVLSLCFLYSLIAITIRRKQKTDGNASRNNVPPESIDAAKCDSSRYVSSENTDDRKYEHIYFDVIDPYETIKPEELHDDSNYETLRFQKH